MKDGAPVTLAIGRVSELYPRAAELKLTPAEARRASGFKDASRRRQFLAGRWLLRQLCCLCVAGQPNDWELNAEGAPTARHRRGYLPPYLSLTHSGDWIAATACADQVAGVDLERLGKQRDWAALLRHYGKPVPKKGQEEAFLRFWTAYEAGIKSGRRGAVRHFGFEGQAGAVQVSAERELSARFLGRPPLKWHLD